MTSTSVPWRTWRSNDSTVTLRGRDAADLYQARLDVLDRSVAATRAALYRAPRDPVLNQYYLQRRAHVT